MFSAPPAPDLNLIDPDNEYASIAAYSLPKSNSNPAIPSIGAMYASMGLSAISAITSAFMQAKSIRAQGEYEATLSRTNSAIALFQGRQVVDAGNVLASRKDAETRGKIGTLRAIQGASGVDVSSGSAAASRAAVRGAGVADELTIRNNAARRAWGYETQAIQDTYKGQFSQLTAKSAAGQSLINGGLQAIQGPLAIESNYLRFSRYMSGGGGESMLPFPDMKTG